MKTTVVVFAVTVAACLGFRSYAMPSSASVDHAGAFIGNWMGVRRIQKDHFQSEEGVDFEIVQSQQGPLVIDRGREAVGQPAAPAIVNGRSISAQVPGMMGGMTFAGQLSSDGKTLRVKLTKEGELGSDAETVQLSLRAGDAARFFEPKSGIATHLANDVPVRKSDDWPVGSLKSSGVNLALLDQMDHSIRAQTRDPYGNETDSVLIAKDGKLVFEQYYWGYASETPHQISSDTKSVTSVVAGIASDHGAIEPTDMIYALFPDYPDALWVRNRYPITIGETLSMTANIDWNEDLPYQDPGNTAVGLAEASDPIAYVLGRRLSGPPGARFQYNSGLPNLIGDAVSRAVKHPFGEYAQTALFDPLGIQNWYWTPQKNGHVLAAGGIYLLPRDMAKIGQMMLDGGVWNHRQIVSNSWVKASTTQQTPGNDYAYGYFWHLSTPAKPRLDGETGFMAIGQGGQYIVVIPRLKAVVVITSSNWQPGGTNLGITQIIDRFIVPALQGKDKPE